MHHAAFAILFLAFGAPPGLASMATGIGIVGALGYLHALTPNLSVDGFVRVVKLDYHASDDAGTSAVVGANSVGVTLGLRYHFGD